MEKDEAVFTSDITRGGCDVKNNLYDLLTIVPAKPLPPVKHQEDTKFLFTPLYTKRYNSSSKVSNLKVKSVRDIRNLYEHDVLSYLPHELEKQELNLMKKIRHGFSTNEKTKELARTILNGNNPITTTAWQMLMNINPDNHKFNKQFIMWNGRRIQVNGSKGGKNKFIDKRDLKNNRIEIRKRSLFNKSLFKRKEGLLRNSLDIKFKPGPLQKKKLLDESHQKYQIGDVELIQLPKPVLEIYPSYGTALEPTIARFVNNLRIETGTISPKWAEYAVSVLGTVANNTPAQLDKKCCITFNLKFKYNRNHLLMRRKDVDIPRTDDVKVISQSGHSENYKENDRTTIEVQKVMKEMLDCVELSLSQEDIYSFDEDYKYEEKVQEKIMLNTKEKPKRKNELNRLDVTVIKLPQLSHDTNMEPCGKPYCAFGCICDSLDCSFNIRQHCGVVDCMFGCKCDLSKFQDMDMLEHESSDLLPGLLKLNNELNSHLAKEEQKFHQTIIVSGEKSIVLKSKKRKCKSSSKYTEFFYDTSKKNEEVTKKLLKVVDFKLDCKNIEPLCMVHNLYKCFCKGRFTDSCLNIKTESNALSNCESTSMEKDSKIPSNDNVSSDFKCILRSRVNQTTTSKKEPCVENNVVDLCSDDYYYNANTCARIRAYSGRKYNDEYYKNTNLKITELEENDKMLKTRMIMLINKSINAVTTIHMNNKTESESGDVSLYYDDVSNDTCTRNKSEDPKDNIFVLNSNKYNLKAWLEASFRWYKERLAKGLATNSLREPKKGLSCLLPWEVILSRYRERKNVYFVSKQPPYRTFLGVDPKHPAFANCLNIDNIRFAELPKYPVIVQNLVTNVTEVNNSFCMLRGWDHSWELIGSAVRIVENSDENICPRDGPREYNKRDGSFSSDSEDWLTHTVSPIRTIYEPLEPTQNIEDKTELSSSNPERSKWFVMKVENDFSEIQFYKKGFFVKYEGIQRSINLARQSGKTVRLSYQTRSDRNLSTQYGIYAIPSMNESCVFIGPYEVDEPLGIEIIKSFANLKSHEKTRGVWITTNKIDNIKVIDNPLSFMPPLPAGNELTFKLDAAGDVSNKAKIKEHIEITQKATPEKEAPKTVKPIKICRTNIIQNIASKNNFLNINKPGQKCTNMTSSISLLKKHDGNLVSFVNEPNSESTSVAYVKPFMENTPQPNLPDKDIQNTMNSSSRPVAEIAPQIKITSEYSESTPQSDLTTNKRQGMLILKPDEINKKVICNVEKSDSFANDAESCVKTTTDIEGFLEQSLICTLPDDNVHVISDGEEDDNLKDICIYCTNFATFGYITGRMKGDKISFHMPGFYISKFYFKDEAFILINRILERKIYIPRYMKLKWRVVISRDIPSSRLLTRQDLEDKKYLFNMLTETRKVFEKTRQKMLLGKRSTLRSSPAKPGSSSSHTEIDDFENTGKETFNQIIYDLEETSNKLENQGITLLNEALSRQTELGTSLVVPVNEQDRVSGELKVIYHMNLNLNNVS